MSYFIADFANEGAFYVGPPTKVSPDETCYLWEPKVSTATWFATKEAARRVARSIDKVEDTGDEPMCVIYVFDWLKSLRRSQSESWNDARDKARIQREINAIQKRIQMGKVPAISADRKKLHRKGGK